MRKNVWKQVSFQCAKVVEVGGSWLYGNDIVTTTFSRLKCCILPDRRTSSGWGATLVRINMEFDHLHGWKQVGHKICALFLLIGNITQANEAARNSIRWACIYAFALANLSWRKRPWKRQNTSRGFESIACQNVRFHSRKRLLTYTDKLFKLATVIRMIEGSLSGS